MALCLQEAMIQRACMVRGISRNSKGVRAGWIQTACVHVWDSLKGVATK